MVKTKRRSEKGALITDSRFRPSAGGYKSNVTSDGVILVRVLYGVLYDTRTIIFLDSPGVRFGLVRHLATGVTTWKRECRMLPFYHGSRQTDDGQFMTPISRIYNLLSLSRSPLRGALGLRLFISSWRTLCTELRTRVRSMTSYVPFPYPTSAGDFTGASTDTNRRMRNVWCQVTSVSVDWRIEYGACSEVVCSVGRNDGAIIEQSRVQQICSCTDIYH